MAPRYSKGRRRVRNPIPVCLPLPRPCLRSLNVPRPPYFMSLSPGMYLPPCTLPPSYFTKPICRCVDEAFCTTSKCRNSTEFLEKQSTFDSCSAMKGETPDLQCNVVQEQQQSNKDQETLSNSGNNVCSTCGATRKEQNASGKNREAVKDNTRRPPLKSKVSGTEDSSTSHNIEQSKHDPDVSEKYNIEKNLLAPTTEFDQLSPEVVVSQNLSNGRVNKSCQTTLSDTQIRDKNGSQTLKKNHLISPRMCCESTASNSNSSSNSEPVYSDAHTEANNITNNKVGCGSCSKQKNIPRDESETKKSMTDSIHLDQLPDQLSNARKKQAHNYSGCCSKGSDKNCNTGMEIETIREPVMEIPSIKITKSRKKTDCECYSNNIYDKIPSKTPKVTDYRCGAKISSTNPSGCRRMPKYECSHHATSHKHNSRKLSESSCPSSTLKHDNFSCTERYYPDASSSTKLSKKSNKSLTSCNVRQSRCECKFPPAYEHLSCTGNLLDECDCNNK